MEVGLPVSEFGSLEMTKMNLNLPTYEDNNTNINSFLRSMKGTSGFPIQKSNSQNKLKPIKPKNSTYTKLFSTRSWWNFVIICKISNKTHHFSFSWHCDYCDILQNTITYFYIDFKLNTERKRRLSKISNFSNSIAEPEQIIRKPSHFGLKQIKSSKQITKANSVARLTKAKTKLPKNIFAKEPEEDKDGTQLCLLL